MHFLDQIQTYVVAALIIGLMVYRWSRFHFTKARIPSLIEQGAQIVDVRSREEFSSGANPTSLNLPLDQLSNLCEQLDRNRPVVLCCASGTRSGMAVAILKSKGFTQVTNAGPWTNTVSRSSNE